MNRYPPFCGQDCFRRALPMAIAVLFVFTLLPEQVWALTAGPNAPGTEANGIFGTAGGWWLGGIGLSDDIYTTQSTLYGEEVSTTLILTNFGFSIPLSATITGVEMNVERRATNNLDQVQDYGVYLFKPVLNFGTDKSSPAIWPGADAIATYGGAGDLWGLTLTPADVNSAVFGATIVAKNTCTLFCFGSDPSIDHVQMTVYYTDGGTASSQTGDGGIPLWLRLLRQRNEVHPDPVPSEYLTVRPFLDADADGVRDVNERIGFPGIEVVVHGRDSSGESVRMALPMNKEGIAKTIIKASSASGYTVELAGTTKDKDGLELSSTPPQVIIPSGEHVEVDLPLRYAAIGAERRCLSVATDDISEDEESDALALLRRLRTANDDPILPVKREGLLVSRRDFFTMVERLLCLTAPAEALSRSLPRDVKNENDKLLVSSLLSRGLPVSRTTTGGRFADLESPILRTEVTDFLAALSAAQLTLSGALANVDNPSPDNEAVAGITWHEAAVALARAAFAAGTIPMSDSAEEGNIPDRDGLTLPKSVLIPPSRTCLEQDVLRAELLHFSDVRPGNPMFQKLKFLVTLGVRNSDDRMLWLLPGTARTAEFGVLMGHPTFRGGQPSSMTDTIRALLVLSCHPPETAAEVRRESANRDAGTKAARTELDRLTGLARTTTVSSRIHYRAQDHIRDFDLSLFAFAENVLQRGPWKSADAFSLREASDVFASTLLFMAVRDGRLNRSDAEAMANDVSERIQTWLLSASPDREVSDPLQRLDLAEFLSAVLPAETFAGQHRSIGEDWFERLKSSFR